MNPVELSIWKEELQGAVEDYMLNPCLKTARAMVGIAGVADKTNAGVILAIAEEGRRIGIPELNRGAWPLFWAMKAGRMLTQSENTWNDYYALRWTFRQDPAAVDALHSRAHSKDAKMREDAEVALIKLFHDPEFRTAFGVAVTERKCDRCAGAIGRYMDRTGERLPAA